MVQRLEESSSICQGLCILVPGDDVEDNSRVTPKEIRRCLPAFDQLSTLLLCLRLHLPESVLISYRRTVSMRKCGFTYTVLGFQLGYLESQGDRTTRHSGIKAHHSAGQSCGASLHAARISLKCFCLGTYLCRVGRSFLSQPVYPKFNGPSQVKQTIPSQADHPKSDSPSEVRVIISCRNSLS